MKTIKILFLLSIITLLTWNTFAATIEKIEAIDNNTVELTASSDVVFSNSKIEWEVKLLKDIWVSFSAKDPQHMNKVLINLASDLTTNSSYSLITVLGAEGIEWNIDFKIWETLTWEILNSNFIEWTKWIQKLNVIDSKTLELYFSDNLTEDLFEFKILSEMATSWLKSQWNNILDIEVSEALKKSSNYILMILSLKDTNWVSINLEEDLYDFVTSADLIQEIVEEPVYNNIVATELLSTWLSNTWNIEIIPNTWAIVPLSNTWNIEEIALKSATTPDTWTATSVLVLLALTTNLAFFFRKKILK